MRTVREVLRLHFEHHLSSRAIARACSISPTTVGDYLQRALRLCLTWAAIVILDDSSLKTLLFAEGEAPTTRKPLPDFDYLRRELKRKGVALQLLWEEYRAIHADGYGRTQFFELYRQRGKQIEPVMRINHKAGDKLYVDFSGVRPSYVDRDTGEIIEPELFVAAMGASSRIFAKAVASQQIPDWISVHVDAFAYFGGVPVCVVPDNLKSGVKTACKYDPETNPVYAKLANHYGVAIVPARPYEPRDKSKAENGVQNAQRRILASLRNHTFFSLAELNDAIAAELEKLNDRPMQGIGKSRNQLFDEIDKPALKALPATRFALLEWKQAKVNIDHHIAVHHSFYSVPYTLIGKSVEVCLTASTIEILHDGKRVASHIRTHKRGVFVTVHEHRPHSHQKHLEWTPERMRRWGETIGLSTGEMIEAIIKTFVHPDHAYGKCLGLLRLSKKYGNERIELACDRALKLQAISYQSVKSILAKGLESAELPQDVAELHQPLLHENVRGSDYYAGGAV